MLQYNYMQWARGLLREAQQLAALQLLPESHNPAPGASDAGKKRWADKPGIIQKQSRCRLAERQAEPIAEKPTGGER